MDESGAGPGNGNGNGGPHVKRTRILLSCSVCRNSKLKCDRAQPCGQCLKKCKPSACEYAPKPEKHKKQAKGMAARLKRLEGMVKGMIDSESLTRPADAPDEPTAAGGQVIRGDRATSYVGGTHFMAILEDIDELKSYFEVPEDEETEDLDAYEEAAGSPELLLFSRSAPRNRDELLALLPEKSVIDRLMMRYFNSNSPSQHILHKPTFSKEYQQFWQDPSKTSYHWLACLFMVISLGVFFSSFQAPHELDADSSSSSPTGAGTAPSAMDRFRQYRNAGGTALVWGKYSRPNNMTLQAFLLYVEGDFMVNRDTQMNCYLLSSVLIRLMLKMGLHRDPSKLPNISPYDGEMRRRYWNLAIQIDLLVSFHLGLPSMIHGIESDTLLPRNLIDEDFDEESRKLPLARPAADYTPLTYPINKAALCRVFGLVARQAHALTVPGYAEVMRVDGVLECTWSQVPGFMKVKPMEESVMDPPLQVVQRFGLASIYQKSRCVLHRRYLTEANPKREHAYSRKTCLEAALALLDYQSIIYGACKPGAMLSHMGWFMSSLAINDFLLADMIVSLVLQSENYPEFGGDSDLMMQGAQGPSRDELLQHLRRSLFIWKQMALRVPDSKKAAEVVETVLRRVEMQMGITPTTLQTNEELPSQTNDGTGSVAGLTIDGDFSLMPPPQGASETHTDFQAYDVFLNPQGSQADAAAQMRNNSTSWMGESTGFYWSQFDALTRSGEDAVQPTFQMQNQDWLDRDPLDDLDFITSTMSWQPSTSQG